jgi:predicted MarR family transcription regulator
VAKRPRGKPFAKGNKISPGRPPKSANLPPSEATRNRITVHEVRQMARGEGTANIKFLIKVRDDEAAPLAVRVMATNCLLDRGFGRPAQQVAVDITTEHTIHVTRDDIVERIRGRIALIRERRADIELPEVKRVQ